MTATRKPRIITLTVKRLRDLADTLERETEFALQSETVRRWADELNAYHGGSANLDPSKRKKRRAVKR